MADTSWLQILINMPPNQPCSVVWRRSCPGAAAAFEGGMDLPSAPGTPVYALADGLVIGAGQFWHPDGSPGYYAVTTRITNSDGSQSDLYYQHIIPADNIQLCNQQGGQLYGGIIGPSPTFQPIAKNQLIGYTSAAGEVEVGVNADWGGIWGDSPHPGAWSSDPEAYIRSLMLGNGGNGSSAPVTGVVPVDIALRTAESSLNILNSNPSLLGPLLVLDTANHFNPFFVPPPGDANVPFVGGIEAVASYPSRVALGVISFISGNTLPFVLRSTVILIGLILMFALIINATSTVTEESGSSDVMKDAAMVAML